jgi:hypothetical protein
MDREVNQTTLVDKVLKKEKEGLAQGLRIDVLSSLINS